MQAQYITYRCTVCRRTKDILEDTTHFMPNGCTITKGCLGILVPEGKTQNFQDTPPDAELTDWYPRQAEYTTDIQPSNTESATNYISLSNSSSGIMNLAIRGTAGVQINGFDPEVNSILILKVLIKNVNLGALANTFTYTIATPNNIVAGLDDFGKMLRFIDISNLIVYVNGIEKHITVDIQNQTVIFAAQLNIGDKVIIKNVSTETTLVSLPFISNVYMNQGNQAPFAWDNVMWLDISTTAANPAHTDHYWIYNSSALPALFTPLSKLRIVGLYTEDDVLLPSFDSFFVLSNPPYSNYDRILDLLIPLLGIDFDITVSDKQSRDFLIDSNSLYNIFPPLIIQRGYTTNTNSLKNDDIINVMSNDDIQSIDVNDIIANGNKYINGPV